MPSCKQALDALHHARVVLGDHLADLDRRSISFADGDDLVQQADALGFLDGTTRPV